MASASVLSSKRVAVRIGRRMSTVTIPSPIHYEPELPGQTVVVISGSAGIGFETARRACRRAKVILTGRNAEHLQHAAAPSGPATFPLFSAKAASIISFPDSGECLA